MSSTDNERMVLRTVYLPTALDQQMKTVAFREDRSKNDVIRELIQAGLKVMSDKEPERFNVYPAVKRTAAARLKPVTKTVIARDINSGKYMEGKAASTEVRTFRDGQKSSSRGETITKSK